ncbi:MAG: M23 family metallopeptidase [bacterium]|nr:M23 family metallopeptidase [bacterium]
MKMERKGYTFIMVEVMVFIALCLYPFIDFSTMEVQDNDLLVTEVSDIHNWNNLTQIVDEEKMKVKDTTKGKGLIFNSHIVKKGENLWLIADKYGVDVSTILGTNKIKKRLLYPGQKLSIPNQKGILHKIRRGESIWDISKNYKIPLREISETNNISDPSFIKAGSEIFLPGAKPKPIIIYRYNKASFSTLPGFVKPCKGPISSKYGYRIHPVYRRWHFHTGIDIKAYTGAKILASSPGQVVFSGWKPGYGKLIVIRHPNGFETYYGHNSVNLVQVGQSVERYQQIARVGETGITTGPHLHFEIRKNGRSENPYLYLN